MNSALYEPGFQSYWVGDYQYDSNSGNAFQLTVAQPDAIQYGYVGGVYFCPMQEGEPTAGCSAEGGGGSSEMGTITVGELVPIHAPDVAGTPSTREFLSSLSDTELIDFVTANPMIVDPVTGRVFEGNARAYELQARAADPSSSIGFGTSVPYEPYTPSPLP